MKFEAKNLSPVVFHALTCVDVSVSIQCFDWSKMKKSSCFFNMVKSVNQRCCLIGMLEARMRIHDNVDPNWAIQVCK